MTYAANISVETIMGSRDWQCVINAEDRKKAEECLLMRVNDLYSGIAGPIRFAINDISDVQFNNGDVLLF